jgi:hypothetical protein
MQNGLSKLPITYGRETYLLGAQNQKKKERVEMRLAVIFREKTGRVIEQEVSSWLPTAAAPVRARSGQMGFEVDKVALGQVFSEYFGFPCQSSFHQILHHNNHPGAGTVGHSVADVPRGPIRTPPSPPLCKLKKNREKTALTPVGILIIRYVSLRTINFPCFVQNSSSPTCYQMIRRSRQLMSTLRTTR